MGSDWLGWNMKGSWAAGRSRLLLFNILKDEQRPAPLLQYDWSKSANADETVKSVLKPRVLKAPKSYFRLDRTRLIQNWVMLLMRKAKGSMWIKQQHMYSYRLRTGHTHIIFPFERQYQHRSFHLRAPVGRFSQRIWSTGKRSDGQLEGNLGKTSWSRQILLCGPH